ncbi:MAG TPA: M1 family metallopeptidase, partial [Ferruginibacter sp.]|nr:M1 family metallopeptidase [Ferruginibacter sp.]
MKKILFLFALATGPVFLMAQPGTESPDTSWKKIFRGSSPRVNDLVHTKLDVRFDYEKSYLYGKAWITLKPHFYNTDSLLLDAKGMDIKEVAVMKGTAKSKLKYTYDGMELRISLDKTYKGGENYTIYIDYVSKPNEFKSKGSAAISDARGLYFINPKGEVKDKPTQIWTQGETEATSVWTPTIDKPNQKTTQEMYMTVPAKYVTLSNGLLMSQKKNADGTRTDYWKMDLPHAPYLFFMGVGDFSIVKDSYKGKEVSYYVEKEYAPVARKIFGGTPEMMKFFSDKLGVEYPWAKYSQIVGRDYVSGAMENTTATLHQEAAYQNARELVDGIGWESTIAHELFHQWFGDLVTAESWSHLTVNESMADYSQTLWAEYKYGKDAGDQENQTGLQNYLSNPNESKKDLVRFRYADKEDMFDLVSYQKGGRIHHMLRNYAGDDAYFRSLNNYLTNNRFKPGEAGQMRLAFEEVTGKDMNWFWNQWFYGSGHPIVKIDYNYDNGKAMVIIEQTQPTGKVFKLPVAIDVYNGAAKKRYNVWVENRIDTFTFSYTQKPDLINVDADKVMLWAKTDNKTTENFQHQAKYAPLYLDRREALDFFAKKTMPELADGLKDKYAPLRRNTITKIGASKLKDDANVTRAIENIANTDKDRRTKAAAISFLAKTKDAKYKPLYEKNITDSSYAVAGASLDGLLQLEPAKAYELAKKYSDDAKGDLGDIISEVLMSQGTEADFNMIAGRYDDMPLSQEKNGATPTFATYLEKVQNVANVKKGIDHIIKFRNAVPEQFRRFVDPSIKGALDKLGKAKGSEV